MRAIFQGPRVIEGLGSDPEDTQPSHWTLKAEYRNIIGMKQADRPAKLRALFVRRASFSHVNASLLDALRRVRPDITFDDLDLNDLMPPKSVAFAKTLLGTIVEYGPSSIRSRHILRYRMLHSVAFHNITRKLIRAAVSRHDYAFTVQTQSLFNAASGDIPNYVYTDNVALERERSAWYVSPGEPSQPWLDLEARIYRDAAHVFTFGSRIRRILVEHYGLADSKATCCGTGANILPATPPNMDLARYARRNIVFAGIDWERKGGLDVLAAFVKLKERLPDATLTIVGCNPPEAAGVPRCTVVGRVSLDVLARLYLDASCLCVPSRYEPFGNVFVEAGHFGLPVVATTVGQIGDVVHDGVNGFRVPPADPEALADALFRVLRDPDEARRMGEASLRTSANFTWDFVAGSILDQACAPPMQR